jgi:hypothetical protein
MMPGATVVCDPTTTLRTGSCSLCCLAAALRRDKSLGLESFVENQSSQSRRFEAAVRCW